MIDPQFFLGYPKDFKGICKIYPPKIKDVVDNDKYLVYKKLLTTSQEEIEDEYTESNLSFENLPTPLEHLLLMASAYPEVKDSVLKAFQFFIHEPVTLFAEQKIIIIGELEEVVRSIKSVEELRVIKEDNFFEFQNIIRQAIGEKEIEAYNPDENPKIKYFKAKARLRDRVKATKSKDGLNLGSSLAAFCCMNFGINPLNIGEMTQVAFSALIRYYQEKNKYEIDIQSLLAGADSKKVKPQNWIRNIEDL